jgi:hypothetical protein
MNRKLIIIPAIALGFVMSLPSFAQTPAKPIGEASPEQKTTPSTRTRAEVQAECVEALNANRTPSGECSPEPSTTSTTSSAPTRAEVQAECRKELDANRTPSGECSPEPARK